MVIALMIIAACEVIRALQNALQIYLLQRDTGARDNAYAAFIDHLKDSDREVVRRFLEEYEAQYGNKEGKEK